MRSSTWKKIFFSLLPLIIILAGLEGFQRIRLFVKSRYDPRYLFLGSERSTQNGRAGLSENATD